jgi:hypothetical protein
MSKTDEALIELFRELPIPEGESAIARRKRAASLFRTALVTEAFSKDAHLVSATRRVVTIRRAMFAVAVLAVAGLLTPVLLPGQSAARARLARLLSAVQVWVGENNGSEMHHDFGDGLQGWTVGALTGRGAADSSPEVSSISSIARPSSLRLWTKSVALQNYQMEFLGQIDKKSLSWAFRARDQNNYYASAILMRKLGPEPNAAFIHYVILNGREWDRVVELPIPMTLERGVNYRVRMSVEDDRFVTYLNGQMISSWSDKRLRRGGVGFFSEDNVSWVSLSERDSFVGRILTPPDLIGVRPSNH